jgi:hypothetical protein
MSYLYILSNPIWKEYIKFGFTTNPTQRLKNYITYSPYPYKLERLWLIKNFNKKSKIDKLLKKKIKNIDYNGGSEFYFLDNYDIIEKIYKDFGYELEKIEKKKIYKLSHKMLNTRK